MRFRSSLLVLVVAAGAVAAPQDEPLDLVWRPKTSDALDYRLAIEIKVQDFKFNFDTDLRMRVVKVDPTGEYEIETATRNMKVVFNGQEEFVPDDEKPTSARFTARGERLGDSTSDPDDKESDPVSRLLNDVSNFTPPEAPVRKGDHWTKVQKADAGKGIDGTERHFEVTAVNRERVHLKVTFRETEGAVPARGTGTFSLRRSDFSLSDVDIDVENFKMDQDAPPGHAHLRLKRA